MYLQPHHSASITAMLGGIFRRGSAFATAPQGQLKPWGVQTCGFRPRTNEADDMGIKPNSIIHHGSGGVIIPASAGYPNELVTRGLTSVFTFQDGSGQTLTDSIGGYNGRLGSTTGADSNDPTWGTSPTRLVFDALDDYVLCTAANDATGTGDYTAVYIYRYGGSGSQYLSFGDGIGLYSPASNAPFRYMLEDASQGQGAATHAIGTDYFMIVDFTASGPTGHIYRPSGGALTTDLTVTPVASSRANGSGWYFGDYATGTKSWGGSIHYCALYNVALTSDERNQNYQFLQGLMTARGITI